jgi:hypothetical protein
MARRMLGMLFMKNIDRRNTLVLASCLIAASAIGCQRTEEQALAEATVTSTLQTSQSGGTGKTVIDGIGPEASVCPVDPEAAAARAASRPSHLYPEQCAVKTSDGAKLHVTLSDCTGPFGKVHLNGGLNAIFSAGQSCSVHAEIEDDGTLTGNGNLVDYQASADVVTKPGERDVTWAAHWTTTTKRGRHVEQDSSLNILVSDSTDCLDIVGTTKGRVDDYPFGTTIDGLVVCPGRCPSAGTVSATFEGKYRDIDLTVQFDGSDIAHVTGKRGRKFDVKMVCDE